MGIRIGVLVCTLALAAPGRAAGTYGPALNADALANTPVGRAEDIQVSYRIRAAHGGPLQAVRPFFIWSYTKAGYHALAGGTIRVQVQDDDGSPEHLPSGRTLGSALVRHPVNDTVGYFPLLALSPMPRLEAGRLYHVVFTNVDPDRARSWVCLDSAYMDVGNVPAQPGVPDTDLATLWRIGARGPWRPRRSGPAETFTPILELDYADGASQGQGYMEFWIGNPKPVSGAKGVRETFTVSGPDRVVAAAAVRLRRVGGAGPLTIRLEREDGTLVDQGQVRDLPAPSGRSGGVWARVAFAAPRRLVAGSTYRLVLAAPAGTTYSAYPIRKGLGDGFKPTTVFPDGYAQFNDGSGWTGWDQWGKADRRDGDLQFYFELATAASGSPR